MAALFIAVEVDEAVAKDAKVDWPRLAMGLIS